MNDLQHELAPVSDAPRGEALASPPDDKHDAEQRMPGAIPGEPAPGRGPAPDNDYSRHEYDHPAAGWGAARSGASVLDHAGAA
jgi:hypothetical protein